MREREWEGSSAGVNETRGEGPMVVLDGESAGGVLDAGLGGGETVSRREAVSLDLGVLRNMDDDEVLTFAKKSAAPYDLVMQTKQLSRLPVVHFVAAGVATPADAALMMQLGCDGVFVGSGVFKSGVLEKSRYL